MQCYTHLRMPSMVLAQIRCAKQVRSPKHLEVPDGIERFTATAPLTRHMEIPTESEVPYVRVGRIGRKITM